MEDKMMQTTIYVGLNDRETKVQKFDTDKYMSILKTICRTFRVAFSVNIIEGGFFHENGTYTEETTLRLVLMDTPEEIVMEIAKDLCAFFNQESVLVTSAPCSAVFVKEEIWDHKDPGKD